MYEQQINAGVEFLNEKFPGWHNEINLDRLDMMDCDRCVLGQLMKQNKLGTAWMVENGLQSEEEGVVRACYLPSLGFAPGVDGDKYKLREEWVATIEGLR